MKLTDLQVKEYLDILQSGAPAPGGGSASALAGAQGIALVMMVCDLTIGKEKYKENEEACKEAKKRSLVLYRALTDAIDKDTEAFNLVSQAFKMPRETEDEKEARKKAIADATIIATEVPYEVMELAFEGLQIAESLVDKSNATAASDLGVAILNLTAAIKGAWLNVEINLPGVKDEDRKEAFADGAKKILENL